MKSTFDRRTLLMSGAALAAAQALPDPVATAQGDVALTIYNGGTTLEESLALWERGEQLATSCQQWLDGARKRLDEALGDEETGES